MKRLMSLLTRVRFSSSTLDARACSLTSSRLFLVKYFFMVFSNISDFVIFSPTKFIRNSKVSSKVKAFAWFMAHKKVNTNNMLQMKKPLKVLKPNWCDLCKWSGSGESINYLFLHCPITLRLCRCLFRQVKVDWISPRSIYDRMIISYCGLGKSSRSKIL